MAEFNISDADSEARLKDLCKKAMPIFEEVAAKKGFQWPREKRGSKEYLDELERQERPRIFLAADPTREEQIVKMARP